MAERTESEARAWVEAHAARAAELENASNLASWEAATKGTEAALRAAADTRAAARRQYCDPEGAAAVTSFLASPAVTDPLLRRQLTLLDLSYRAHRLPEAVIDELSERESELERVFYTFRPEFEGKEVSNNELLDVLRANLLLTT